MAITIGVLCLQGGFLEHIKKLKEIRDLKAKDNIVLVVREIRKAEELDGLDGLIVPGGETTTLHVFLSRDGFEEKLKTWLSKKPAVWGTCAGTILFADEVKNQRSGGQSTVCRGYDFKSLHGQQYPISIIVALNHNTRVIISKVRSDS